MQKSLTQKEIVEDLKRLGLERGTAVEVHSSLSSIGFVEGGALTVINALMEVISEEGAMVMSAYNASHCPYRRRKDERNYRQGSKA